MIWKGDQILGMIFIWINGIIDIKTESIVRDTEEKMTSSLRHKILNLYIPNNRAF